MGPNQAEHYLNVLGLHFGAGEDDVRRTYKELVMVWHPDRFPRNPSLRAKASERTARIVEAYRWLMANPDAWKNQTAARTEADTATGASSPPPPPPPPPNTRASRRASGETAHEGGPRFGRGAQILLSILVVLVGLVLSGRLFDPSNSRAETSEPSTSLSETRPSETAPGAARSPSGGGGSSAGGTDPVVDRWITVERETWGDFTIVTEENVADNIEWYGAGYNPFRSSISGPDDASVPMLYGSPALEDFTGDGRQEVVGRSFPEEARCCYGIQVLARRNGGITELFRVFSYAPIELDDLDSDGVEELVMENVLSLDGIGLCRQPALPIVLRWNGYALEDASSELDRARIEERLATYRLEVLSYSPGELANQDFRAAVAGLLGAGAMLGTDRLFEVKEWLGQSMDPDVISWVNETEDQILRQALRRIPN